MAQLVKKFKMLSHMAYVFMRYALLYLPARLAYRGRSVWLVSERGTDARDNGYHFFKYLRASHPEIEAYYVITRDSPDRARAAALGNTVDFQSTRHYMLSIAAKYLVSTHYFGTAPDNELFRKLRRITHRRFFRGKVVFLQHGIIKDNIPALYQENTLLDLFICGAKPEFDYIDSQYHYRNGEVRYTGLARYDQLLGAETKPQILIMPTWRQYLKHGTAQEIADSDYAKRWNSLLHSERLARLAEKYQAQVIFYPHYEIQKYLSVFSSDSRHVVVADFAHYDVQQLLKESMLLITDYSSVFFDFAYMKKPMLFYQFDEDRFFSEHYQKGYFDYRRDGFGEVATEEDALLTRLEDYFRLGLKMKPAYEARIDRFFPLRDTNNCRRIYEEIQKLQK